MKRRLAASEEGEAPAVQGAAVTRVGEGAPRRRARTRPSSRGDGSSSGEDDDHDLARPAPSFDPADDCETPLVAYKHVAPLLAKLAQRLKKPKDQLLIWDPYYCDGAVATHLGSLGFPNVHNRAEDFYAVIRSGEMPPHDVIVTNPPFSGDHVKRLVRFLASASHAPPFFVLAPEYVHRKAWYAQLERERPEVFYVVPPERYRFIAASGGRAQNTDVPCRHWAREGRCPRGDACPFIHARRGTTSTGGEGERGRGDGGAASGRERAGAPPAGTTGVSVVKGNAVKRVVAPFD